MYATAANHSVNIIRYLLVYAVLFFLLPRIAFVQRRDSLLEDFFASFIKTVLVIIVLGYVLVPLKLFEMLAFILLFIFLVIIKYWESISPALQLSVFDFVDGRIRPGRIIRTWFKRILSQTSAYLFGKFRGAYQAGSTVLSLSVLGYALYLRFYDAFINAAPAMSDAYVTLAWMKYINRRLLFYDGIYPQGFHIFLAVIQKLSAIDSLYVLKYTGPFNAFLITVGIYLIVSRLTGKAIYGAGGAAVYGLFGEYLPVLWQRQASTNSQEFAFVFVLPTLYFCYLYIKNSRREDLYTAGAGVFVIGLTHTLAFLMAGMGLGVLGAGSLIIDCRRNAPKVLRLAITGFLAVVVSILPAGLGLLMGKHFHSAAAEYLVTETIRIGVPSLAAFDWAALFALAAIIMAALKNYLLKEKEKALALFFMALLGSTAFFAYMWGGVLTNSEVISGRSGEIWAIMIAVLIGLGLYALSEIIPILKRLGSLELLLAFVLLVYTVGWIKPQPIIPYKMEHNSNVEQYLRISSTLRPTEWMIVSQEEGYALAYGKGYHLYLADFLAWYDPTEKELISRGDQAGAVLKTPDIFIFQEKQVYDLFIKAGFDYLQSTVERRKREYRELAGWVESYKLFHDNLSVYYEDDYIRVFHIHQPLSNEETFEDIWNSGGVKS